MAILDLTGLRSGKLTALYRLDEKKRGNCVWLAKCDCGKEVKAIASDLLNGRVKSCGCARKEKNVKDLRGMRFGELTAIERLPQKKGSSYLWRCRCACGDTTAASTAQLMNGTKKSCGCLKIKHGKEMASDIGGQKFGKLTALRPTDKRLGGSVVWTCRCDCGNLCEASVNELRAGNTKSCGCLLQTNAAPPAFRWEEQTAETYRQRKRRADNTSGYTGVQKTKNGKWHAFITVNKHTYHLGTYEKISAAALVRQRAEALALEAPPEKVAEALANITAV